jgi:mannosyltransferase
VAAEAGPDDVLVTCPDQLGPAVRRALDAEGLASMPVLAYPALGDGRFVDWYDYVERNDAADPAAVGAEVLTRAEPTGRIWAVTNGSYRSFEGDCEALVAAISVGRPAWRALIADRADDVFEPAGLVVFEAVG